MDKDAAKNFAFKWSGHGDEERDYLIFWQTMFRDVFGIAKPEEIIKPQYPVQFEHSTRHIDILIPRTKVLIEQKSFGTNLDKIARQSDGEYLTPFEQAKRYADALPYSARPRWIITCNFNEFHIYDLQQMDSLEYLSDKKIYSPTVVKLENFHNDCAKLEFIVNPNADIKPEIKISTDAAKIVRKICKAIDKDYTERDAARIDALSKLCARLVFCFYADDAGLFKENNKFADYLKNFSYNQLQDALQKFFDALNTPEDERADLKNFPYVDGGLFEEKIPIPPLNQSFKHEVEYAHILRTAAGNFRIDEFNNFMKFSWRDIDATIFGAMFEAIFNDETRRSDGIHYTAKENIHKVIDPLFLDDLNNEFAEIIRMQKKNRVAALKNFQDKLAALNFLDPACGSGNFLTETYLSLRHLENKIIKELKNLSAELPDNPIKVLPQQFHGIEINDFAVAVAKDAMWIAEIQMLRRTSFIIGHELDELPLRKNISIVRENALRVDWKKFAPKIDFIIGNPPFRGYSEQTPAQKADIRTVYSESRKAGKIDYVAAWYKKAAEFIRGTKIRCAFVSTNSICQGEQCADVWKILYEKFDIHVDFCHRTFKWRSDSNKNKTAHVHCVIVGFSSAHNPKPKMIFDGDKVYTAENINFYLTDGEIVFVEAHNEHIQDGVPKIIYGNKLVDGGNLIIEADEIDYFIKNEPAAEKYIYRLLGADSFINGKKRYCLWLEGVPMSEIKKMPLVFERVENCRQYRLASKKAVTRANSATPHLFQEIRQPKTDYIFIPRISSERRFYIPIDFLSANVIATDAAQVIPNATLYHFGILTSSIHMAWVRAVAGRFEVDFNYSASIVYNNFIWCSPTLEQKSLIAESAQKILDVRGRYPDWTFAKLYNEETMPDSLRAAHKYNDYVVSLAYGFDKFLDDEARVVAELMKLYKKQLEIRN